MRGLFGSGGGSSRRHFLGSVGGLAATCTALPATADPAPGPVAVAAQIPFHGPHQAGIATPPQRHTFFAAFDLATSKRADVAEMLRRWTDAAARLTEGDPAEADSGETLEDHPARLTVTFGFGAGLFVKDGHDRYGLAAHRPAGLIDLPKFHGDELIEASSGGDLSVQACADDPQIAFHAVRRLARLAGDTAELRWTQTGFIGGTTTGRTPRNLMGFRDGTANPPADSVWVGPDAPGWLRGGSYLVVRKIRMALEHWDSTDVDFQEEVIGRHKRSGAPLGGAGEFDPLDLDAADAGGDPVIPQTAHVRLAAPQSNGGATILRRAYSYHDGTNVTAERWPPWRQGLEYDAGLLFICYQPDPRTGFVRIFETMAKLDALNQFTTHVGSALFACPGGVAPGTFIGQRLFDMG